MGDWTMSDFVKINKDLLKELVDCSWDALNLLDNTHSYDYVEYRALEKVLSEIKFEENEQ